MKIQKSCRKFCRVTFFYHPARLISPLVSPANGAVRGITWEHPKFSGNRSGLMISFNSALRFACFLNGPRNHTTFKKSSISRNWSKTSYTCHRISFKVSVENENSMFFVKNLFRRVANTAARWADRENHEFLRNSLEKHRFDLGKSPANWKTLNFIQKSIDLTSVFPLPPRFAKNDVPQSLWFPTFELRFFDTSRNVAVAPV